MGRIRLLDDHLINRIAAGEVVERPASVIKELVENSLDAGARSIVVSVQSGGKRGIRCEDDGCGMDADDAVLALTRHATSKLRSSEDLDAIDTLGFRGEALPSIAAVSRFLLRTATENGKGYEVEIHGGEQIGQRNAACPRGTTIQVDRLFYNVPARKKFLKADATELSHIVRGVTRFALANPTIGFKLQSGSRTLLDTPGATDLGQRIGQVYGAKFMDKLLPFQSGTGDRLIHGFAGRPAEALPRRDLQHVFVNGRFVQDRVLLHAIRQAYGNTMPRDRHPALFLFLDLDPRSVDVNVHPQKTEVRFRDSSEIHGAVSAAIGSVLGQAGAVPELTDLRPNALHRSGASEALQRFVEREPTTMPPPLRRPPSPGFWPSATSSAEPAAAALSEPAPRIDRQGSARVLGQYLDSYIIAQDEQGILLVDQHAAHERVLFEKYLEDAGENRVEIQRLAFPITLEVTREESLLFEAEQEELRRLGFLAEAFGPTTIRVDGVPAVAADVDAGELLRGLLGEAAEVRHAATDVAQLRRRLITNAACQAAIKINHRLTHPGMQSLIDDLYRLRSPTTCPHGRPLIFRLSRSEIERAFDR